MATPPFGTLCFSGWGDDPFEFRDVDGNVVAPPASNPIAGSGCDGIVSLSDGKVCVIGGNAPNFGTTGVGILSVDFATPTQFLTSPFPGTCIARDTVDNFYGVRNATRILYKYNAAGTQTAVTSAMAASTISAFAVNGAGTICYFVLSASLDTIRGWDLIGDTDLGVITTETGYRANGNNGLYSDAAGDLFVGWDKVAAGDGYVKRYNSTGTLQQTYTLGGTSQTPICVTNGVNEDTFWICFYNASVSTFSGVTVAEFDVVSGSVLHTFDPEDGSFQFDASFCVLGFQTIDEVPPQWRSALVHSALASSLWETTGTNNTGITALNADGMDFGSSLSQSGKITKWIAFKAEGEIVPGSLIPTVDAGPNQSVNAFTTVTLAGSGTAGNYPCAALTYLWTKIFGDGTPTFVSATNPTTNVTFSASGIYILRLTASNGLDSVFDDVQITINNSPPIVNAGFDQTVLLTDTTTLAGSALDDGLPVPPGLLTTTWSKISGPGTASFADASSLGTTVSFSAAGVYILLLIAFDGEKTSADSVAITVLGGNIGTCMLPSDDPIFDCE